MEKIIILSPKGEVKGIYKCYIDEPRFIIPVKSYSEMDSILVNRNDIVRQELSNGCFDERPIIGVSIVDSLSPSINILAPKLIKNINIDEPFICFDNMELRAGTIFTGGRNSGFYDGECVIIKAIHIGGDPQKFEDWAYYIIGKNFFGEKVPNWILLDDIGPLQTGPSLLFNFEVPKNEAIDTLIANGDSELFEYLVTHPSAFESINAEQFEKIMISIYKNLGFEVVQIGKWNQADGGIDLIAISRTETFTNFKLAIQCKTSKNKISAKPIRELAGVLDIFKAHQGIVATTSTFTGSARKETEGHMWKLALQDRDDIVRRLISIVCPELRGLVDRY